MRDIYICKIPLENLSGEILPIYTEWRDKGFSVNFYHKDKAWNKYVSEDDIKSLCSITKLTVVDYLRETKRALTCDGGCGEFTYSLINTEFIWKKVVDCDNNIKIKFGSLLLEEMSTSGFVESTVDFLLKRCNDLAAKANSLKEENDGLRAANTSLRSHVCNVTKLKTEMEESFYTKYLVVLNAKKNKIRELYKMIETLPTTSAGKKAEYTEEDKDAHNLTDYGSETELDTDENSDECPVRSSTLTISKVREKEDDTEYCPSASKLQKFDHKSSDVTTECTFQEPNENYVDIFVPARRKKSNQS